MAHALEPVPVRLLSYCLMPNHWHLLLFPQEDGQLGRWNRTEDGTGTGPVRGMLPVFKGKFLTAGNYWTCPGCLGAGNYWTCPGCLVSK